MSIKFKLSDSNDPDDIGISSYNNFTYESDQDGGNSAETNITFSNEGGNPFNLCFQYEGQDIRIEVESFRVEMLGSLERMGLLRMLHHILEAEKIANILK
jgi:hypothetical protein